MPLALSKLEKLLEVLYTYGDVHERPAQMLTELRELLRGARGGPERVAAGA